MLKFQFLYFLFAFATIAYGYSIDSDGDYHAERFGKIVNPIESGHHSDISKSSKIHTKVEHSKHHYKSEEKHVEKHEEHHHGCDPKYCVPYHLCSVNNTIIKDGAGLLDSRYFFFRL